jgi:hypothetical protein
MRRAVLDKVISGIGVTLAALMLIAAGLLTWANTYIDNEVHSQLAEQQIFFPAKDSPAIAAPEFAAMKKYAGQQLTTGDQAETYADHFIANHLKTIGGGQTYAQLSTQAQSDPTNTKLAGTVETMFKGETLRGLLLNAYAFGKMATIAGYAAVAAYIGAAVLLVLSFLGFWHSRRAPGQSAAAAGQHENIALPVA